MTRAPLRAKPRQAESRQAERPQAEPRQASRTMTALLFAAPATALGQLAAEGRGHRLRAFLRRHDVADKARRAAHRVAYHGVTLATASLAMLVLALLEQLTTRSSQAGSPLFSPEKAALCGDDQLHLANLWAIGAIALAATLCGAIVAREDLWLSSVGTCLAAIGAWLLLRPNDGCAAAGIPRIGPSWNWDFQRHAGLPWLVFFALLCAVMLLIGATFELCDRWDLD